MTKAGRSRAINFLVGAGVLAGIELVYPGLGQLLGIGAFLVSAVRLIRNPRDDDALRGVVLGYGDATGSGDTSAKK